MLQEKNAFVSLFSWLYANFIVTNSGNAGLAAIFGFIPVFMYGAWLGAQLRVG